MKARLTAMLSVAVVGLVGLAAASASAPVPAEGDDNTTKIVGVWIVEKSDDLPAGSSVEFTKEGKILIVAKAEGSEIKIEGTYKIEKEKLTVKLKVDADTVEETATIKKLTADALEIEDKDKKVDTFKKKK